ncbi:hypothetical protein [Natrinema sp. H-ect4]|uniref:hypothetical protein n=1 Tax=Natrinema sp. H-ect4 TaxID=3242699 RepID=UPI0035A8AA86
MKLEEYGLTQIIGNGVYTITQDGERYLQDDLDARTLEKKWASMHEDLSTLESFIFRISDSSR